MRVTIRTVTGEVYLTDEDSIAAEELSDSYASVFAGTEQRVQINDPRRGWVTLNPRHIVAIECLETP